MHKTLIVRFTEALLYIVFGAGCILWLALPFFLDQLLRLFLDVYIKLPFYREFTLVFLMFAGAAGLFIVFDLIRLFRTLGRDPFVARNVKALKRMGVSAMVVTALFVVKCFVYFTPMTLVCALMILLLSLFAFVLSNLFEKAVEYKTENDLTI